MNNTVGDYFRALNALDRSAFIRCFSQEAEVRDPYGGPTLHGAEGLHEFFDGMERTWSSFTMTPDVPYAAGDRVAVSWKASATARSGKTAEFSGINVFTLDDQGLIKQLEAYWDFRAMLAQIR